MKSNTTKRRETTLEAYRERVMGCWVGKVVGGTLGQPWEGKAIPYELTYYDPVPQGMLANDDLDLQVVWLQRIRETGLPITGFNLATCWRDNINMYPDEYGVARRNFEMGLRPPAMGAYDNGCFAGMGAAIRTELWACLAPGNPELAAHFAREDASMDHAKEGIDAAVFLATVESLAFVESGRAALIQAGLEAIPERSRVARCVRAARKYWQAEGEYKKAFERLNAEFGNQNFTDTPINLGIIALGWLSSEGDHGQALLNAVNCGYDTDCTGATLGAILGLLEPRGFEEKWLKPVGGDLALSPAITGMAPPRDLDELTEQVVELAYDVQKYYGGDCLPAPSAPRKFPSVKPRLPAASAPLLKGASAQTSRLAEHPVAVSLEYPFGLRAAPGRAARYRLHFVNTTAKPLAFGCGWETPAGWILDAAEEPPSRLEPGVEGAVELQLTPLPGRWRPFSSRLGVVLDVEGVPIRLEAGLLQTIPWLVWKSASPDLERCPEPPEESQLIEASEHFIDLDALPDMGEGSWVFQTRFKGYRQNRNQLPMRLVAQTAGRTRLWLNGERIHEHDGRWRVRAIHRAQESAVVAEVSADENVLTVTTDAQEEIFFHAIGETHGGAWHHFVEYGTK